MIESKLLLLIIGFILGIGGIIMAYIAVIMAIYGGDNANCFREAIRSVIDQKILPGYEMRIYLGVDGPLSSDLENAVSEYRDHIFLIDRSIENIGLAGTLNRLIKARGAEEFFFRMDSDDISLPGRFISQLSYMKANPHIDILGTAIWECGPSGLKRQVKFPETPEEALRLIDRRVPVAHPTACIRRRVFDSLGGYPEAVGNEDIAFWFKCIRAGFNFANIRDPLYIFKINDSFWKRRNKRKALGEFFIYVKGIWSIYGLSWRYIFPVMRLALRLSPEILIRYAYASRVRRGAS